LATNFSYVAMTFDTAMTLLLKTSK